MCRFEQLGGEIKVGEETRKPIRSLANSLVYPCAAGSSIIMLKKLPPIVPCDLPRL